MFYLVCGGNGVIIKEERFQAERCMKYLFGSTIHSFACLEEASKEAVKHLHRISPDQVKIPEQVELDDMITVVKLKYPGQVQKKSSYRK